MVEFSKLSTRQLEFWAAIASSVPREFQRKNGLLSLAARGGCRASVDDSGQISTTALAVSIDSSPRLTILLEKRAAVRG